jgi:hypothetical protein
MEEDESFFHSNNVTVTDFNGNDKIAMTVAVSG